MDHSPSVHENYYKCINWALAELIILANITKGVDMRWAQWQFFVIMRKNGEMKNESNSLYISTSYYDRINFDTYPWWTSISVRILMLGTHTHARWRCACTFACVRVRVCVCVCVWYPHEWNKKGTRRVAPGKSYNRNRCAPTKLLCPLSYAYVCAWIQEYVA